MVELLKKLGGSRWGVAGVLVAGGVAVGASVVPHDSPEAQGAFGAALLLVVAAGALLGPKAAAWIGGVLGKGGSGEQPK